MSEQQGRTEEVKVAGFSWVVEGVLAGSAAPGSHPAVLSEDLASLARAGVTAVVSLNEAHPPLQPEDQLQAALAANGGPLQAHLHLPVPDYRPPTIDQMQRASAALCFTPRGQGVSEWTDGRLVSSLTTWWMTVPLQGSWSWSNSSARWAVLPWCTAMPGWAGRAPCSPRT